MKHCGYISGIFNKVTLFSTFLLLGCGSISPYTYLSTEPNQNIDTTIQIDEDLAALKNIPALALDDFDGQGRLTAPYNTIPAATSYGDTDPRVIVPFGNPAFNAIGRLRGCSAIITYIDGFESNHPIVLTARHCVEGLTTQELQFMTMTEDSEGNPTIFRSDVISGVHSNYRDIAILLLTEPIPETIQPARLLLGYQYIRGQSITTAGFGSGREEDGLTAHYNCNITLLTPRGALSNCGISSGDSGSPTIVNIINGQLIIGGINVAVIDGLLERAIHQTVPSRFLEDNLLLNPTP